MNAITPHRLVCFLAPLLLAAPVSAQYSRLIGTVADEAGKPVVGAAVEAHNPNHLPAVIKETADKKGRFTFGRLTDGAWRIVVQAEGFRPHQEVIEADADVSMPQLKIRLERLAPPPPAEPPAQAKAAREAFQRGVDAFRAGNFQAALAAFQEFKTLEPKNVEIALNLALAHQALEDYPAAIAAYRAYLGHQPEHVEARIRLGECLVKSGALDAALAEFQNAIGKRPDDAMLQYNVGEILFSAERREEAIERYRKAVELDPQLADGHLKLAFCLVALDRKTEALPHLRRYLELKPDAPNAKILQGLIAQIEGSQGPTEKRE